MARFSWPPRLCFAQDGITNTGRALLRSVSRCGHAALVALGLVLVGTAAADGFRGLPFGSGVDGEWYFSEAEAACVLEQPVPSFGHFRFLRRAGRPLEFRLESVRELLAADGARIDLRTPQWHAEHPQQRTFPLAGGTRGKTLVVDDPTATRMLMALKAGYEPHVVNVGWFADDVTLTVAASSTNFGRAYPHFIECFEGLLPASWSEIERSRMNYDTDVYALTKADRARLQLITAYLNADPTVARVYIDGHTDNVGGLKDNFELSKNRAETVAELLRSQGLGAAELVVRYHADRYPVAGNDSAPGRAQNRRTTIRLERDAERMAAR